MKKYMRRLLLLAACLILVLMAAGCGSKLSAKKVQKDPVSYIKAGVELTNNAWAVNKDLKTLLESAKENCEVDLDVDLSALLGDVSFSNKFYKVGNAFADEISGSLQGQAMDLMAYYDGGVIGLRSGFLLDTDKTYSLNLKDFLDQGEKSNIAQLLGLDEETFEQLKELFATAEGSVNSMDEAKVKEYEDKIWNILSEKGFEVKEESADIAGTKADAVVITGKMDTDTIKKLLDAIFEFAGTDNDTVKALKDELEPQLEDMELDMTISWILNKASGALMAVNISEKASADGEKADAVIGVVYGADPKTSGKMSLTASVKSEEEDADLVMDIAKKSEGKSVGYTLDASIKTSEEEVKLSAELLLDTESKAYTITLKAEAEGETQEFEVKGTVNVEKDMLKITVDSVKAAGVSVDTNITLTLKTSAQFPVSKDSTTDLLKLKDEELMEIMEAVGTKFGGADIGGDIDVDGGEECSFCFEAPTQTIEYYGVEYNVCDEHAAYLTEKLTGNYCYFCDEEIAPADVLEAEENGCTVKVCPECYETFYGTENGSDPGPLEGEECEMCFEPAVCVVDFIGTEYNLCEEHADYLIEIRDGNYCYNCMEEFDSVNVIEEAGLTVKLCDDCYAELMQ